MKINSIFLNGILFLILKYISEFIYIYLKQKYFFLKKKTINLDDLYLRK